jgi:hypothetical protein
MSYSMPWRRQLDDQYVNLYGSFYQICRSSRSNTTSQSGLFMLICALTSCILEVSWGEVHEIILARICNLFAKFICAYTSRRKCFAILIQFCKDQGSTFLKLALLEDSVESRSQRIEICPNDSCCTLFSLGEFSWNFSHEVFNEATKCKCNLYHHALFLHIFPTGFFGVLTRHALVAVFAQGGVLRNPN